MHRNNIKGRDFMESQSINITAYSPIKRLPSKGIVRISAKLISTRKRGDSSREGRQEEGGITTSA